MNTILEETPAQTRMGVGFGPHRKGADAWKQSIGTKKVPARLEMLPEGESRLNRVGASAAVQIVLLSFFVALPVFFPERMNTLRNMAFIPLAMPVTEVPVAPPPRPPKIRKVEVKPEIVEPVKLNPKQPHIFVQQKVLQPKIEKLEAKFDLLKDSLASAKVWALVLYAGLAGAMLLTMARGFKWI